MYYDLRQSRPPPAAQEEHKGLLQIKLLTAVWLSLTAAALSGCSRSLEVSADAAGDGPESDAPSVDHPPQIDGADADLGPPKPERSGLPLPAGVAPPIRILDATARIPAQNESACTHQEPPSGNGDRWCAFTRPGATDDVVELWVVNVSLAATGQVPVCDGIGSGCLRLTSEAFTRSANVFEGDTLFYYAGAVSPPAQEYLGPVYGWRPGWSKGRQLTSERGLQCSGHRHVPVAVCLEDPEGDPAKRNSVQVRVGALADGQDGPLPAFGRWPLRNDNDTAWQAGFSPDGMIFGLSNADSIGAVQSLRVVDVRDVGQVAPKLIIEDIQYWSVSNDGQKIYFVRGLPPNPTSLLMADFPVGTNIETIETDVLGFSLIGVRPEDHAVGIDKNLGSNKGTFNLLRDPGAPKPTPIFAYEDILDGARVSLDLRYTVWMDFAFRGFVIRNNDLATCALNQTDGWPVFEAGFLDHASLLFWNEISREDPSRRDGFYATPEKCGEKKRFAQGIDFYASIGDQTVVYADEHDGDQGTSTLKYSVINSVDGSLAATPFRIREGVKAPVLFAGSAPPLLVFKAESASAEEAGTYVFALPEP